MRRIINKRKASGLCDRRGRREFNASHCPLLSTDSGRSYYGLYHNGTGISIHRSDCEQFLELQQAHPERVVESIWGDNYASGFKISIRIIASDRSGLLRDITTVLANDKISVLGVSSRTDTKNN